MIDSATIIIRPDQEFSYDVDVWAAIPNGVQIVRLAAHKGTNKLGFIQ